MWSGDVDINSNLLQVSSRTIALYSCLFLLHICHVNTTLPNFRKPRANSNLFFLISTVSETVATFIPLTQVFVVCFLDSHTAGFRSSALLAMLLCTESASDSELCPASPESSQVTSTATDVSSLPGSTAAICSPSSPKYKVRSRKGIPNHSATSQY